MVFALAHSGFQYMQRTIQLFEVRIYQDYSMRSKLDANFAIFKSESLKWPSFVEFDDANERCNKAHAKQAPPSPPATVWNMQR